MAGIELVVGMNPRTGKICCTRRMETDELIFSEPPRDVTDQACAAVAQHALMKGGTITVTADGKPRWEIIVREVRHDA